MCIACFDGVASQRRSLGDAHGRHARTAGRVGCMTIDMVSPRTLWRSVLWLWSPGFPNPMSDETPFRVTAARAVRESGGGLGAVYPSDVMLLLSDLTVHPAHRGARRHSSTNFGCWMEQKGGTCGHHMDGCVACQSTWCHGLRCGWGCVCLWSCGPMEKMALSIHVGWREPSLTRCEKERWGARCSLSE